MEIINRINMENTGEDRLENLWGDCMNETAMQNFQKDSYLVLLGDHGCGKKAIVNYISQNILKTK